MRPVNVGRRVPGAPTAKAGPSLGARKGAGGPAAGLRGTASFGMSMVRTFRILRVRGRDRKGLHHPGLLTRENRRRRRTNNVSGIRSPNTLSLEQFTNCTTWCKRGVGVGRLSKQDSAASPRVVPNSSTIKLIAKDKRETMRSLSACCLEVRIGCCLRDKVISLHYGVGPQN
jgi:hypothetical protein